MLKRSQLKMLGKMIPVTPRARVTPNVHFFKFDRPTAASDPDLQVSDFISEQYAVTPLLPEDISYKSLCIDCPSDNLCYIAIMNTDVLLDLSCIVSVCL